MSHQTVDDNKWFYMRIIVWFLEFFNFTILQQHQSRLSSRKLSVQARSKGKLIFSFTVVMKFIYNFSIQ